MQADSDKTEAKVRTEIDVARYLINHPRPEHLFSSPYLVSALYYRANFAAEHRTCTATGSTCRIILAIKQMITPAYRDWFMQTLRSMATAQEQQFQLTPPLQSMYYKKSRRSHPNAADLFSPEGSPVTAAAGGIIVLAEDGWTEQDQFSTSSPNGGNTVIEFVPHKNLFIRYAHLGSVAVRPGSFVSRGDTLGTVGHSGLNACRRGHGGHLHLEINQYNQVQRSISAFSAGQIIAALR